MRVSFVLLIFFLILVLPFVPALEQHTKNNDFNLSSLSKPNGIPMYFIYSPNCIHCKNVKNYLLQLSKDYNLNVKGINKQKSKLESDFFQKILKTFNSNDFGVPVIVINNHIYHGDIAIIKNLKPELEIYKTQKYGFYTLNNKNKAVPFLFTYKSILLVSLANPFLLPLFPLLFGIL